VGKKRLRCDSILSSEGRDLGAIGIVDDVSERLKAEQALRESERQLRFLSSRLLELQEEENARLARQMHDSIGQTPAEHSYPPVTHD